MVCTKHAHQLPLSFMASPLSNHLHIFHFEIKFDHIPLWSTFNLLVIIFSSKRFESVFNPVENGGWSNVYVYKCCYDGGRLVSMLSAGKCTSIDWVNLPARQRFSTLSSLMCVSQSTCLLTVDSSLVVLTFTPPTKKNSHIQYWRLNHLINWFMSWKIIFILVEHIY